MYRVQLTEDEREELKQRTRAAGVQPRTRDRLEMIRLLDAGWRIPRIAAHLRVSPRRVRYWVRCFREGGFDALPDQPHRGQQSQLTPALVAALRTELAKGDRTWSAPQVAAWLAEHHGVRLSANHLGSLLRRAGLSYRRTERSLKHKQDPAEVERRRHELRELERGEPPGAWTSPM